MANERNTKYLSEEEMARLFAVIKSPRDRAMFRLAYHRGLRATEIGLLQLSDYRTTTSRLFVHRLKAGSKSGDMSGEYSMTDIELKTLKAWLKVRGSHPGAIFTSNRKTAISQQMLDFLMKKYCKMAGISPDKSHMHALRHSCATHLLDLGQGIENIRDHLGHSSIASTTHYAKITNKHREKMGQDLKGWK